MNWLYCPTSASHGKLYRGVPLRHLLFLATPPRPGGEFGMLPEWANQASLQHTVACYEEAGLMCPDEAEMHKNLDSSYIEHLRSRRALTASFVGQDLACVTLLLSACTPDDGEVLDAILGMNAGTAHAVGGLSRGLRTIASLPVVQERYVNHLAVDIAYQRSGSAL